MTYTKVIRSYLLALWLFSPVLFANATPQVTFHFDGWVNFALEKLETDGITGGFHRHTRPRTRWEVAEAIRRAEERIATGRVKPSPIHLQLLEKLKQEFGQEIAIGTDAEERHRFRGRGSMQVRSRRERHQVFPAYEGAFYYHFGKQLTLYQAFEIQDSFEKYPIQGKTASKRLNLWRWNYTTEFKRVYLRFPLSKFEVLIGRNQVFWGTGFRGAVGISDNSPPLDLVLLTGVFGKIKGTAFAAQLDKMWHDQTSRRYLANRYMAGHRIDYQVNDRLELGISELVIYGGDVQDVEWRYLNPILPYYASQFNADMDDNVMLLFEGAIRPTDGIRLYAECLLDDIQYANGGDPNAVAWLAGLEWNGLQSGPSATEGSAPSRSPWSAWGLHVHRLGIRAEYARVNRWAYTHLVEENQFTHFGSIIGHRVGTDADTFYLEGGYLVNVDSRVSLFYELERQGEASVADRYRGEDYKSIPFPSGIVERRDGLGIRLIYEPRRAWQCHLAYQHVVTKNRNHQKGINQHSNELEFRLRYLFEL